MLFLFALILMSAVSCRDIESKCIDSNMVNNFVYPDARRDDTVVDDFHGIKVNCLRRPSSLRIICVSPWAIFNIFSVVDCTNFMQIADPYRWLEDPDSEETKQYVDAENKVAQPFLESCDQWKKINEKLTGIWDYPKYNVPDRHGKYYFTYTNTGLQNQK